MRRFILQNIFELELTRSLLTDHEAMLGLKREEAGSDMMPRKKVKTPMTLTTDIKDEELEEWHGVGTS